MKVTIATKIAKWHRTEGNLTPKAGKIIIKIKVCKLIKSTAMGITKNNARWPRFFSLKYWRKDIATAAIMKPA